MIFLTLQQTLNLHEKMLKTTGGGTGIRDIKLLESALAQALATFDGQELYPTLEEKASRIAYSIVNNHPFVDGNKRTGLFAMLVFLELNNIILKFSQQELIDLGLGLASSQVSFEQLHKWIVEHKKEL